MLPDELVYSDLARSIADGGRPAVRDVPVFGWGEVYPALIAPVWALVEDRYVAYHATLAVNAIVMSLAAIPAYFLARLVRLARRRRSSSRPSPWSCRRSRTPAPC